MLAMETCKGSPIRSVARRLILSSMILAVARKRSGKLKVNVSGSFNPEERHPLSLNHERFSDYWKPKNDERSNDTIKRKENYENNVH